MKNKLWLLPLALVVSSGLVVGAQNPGARAAETKPAAKPAAKAAAKPAAPAAKYAGTENCKMCHSEIHDDWAKTAHAKSFDLLVNVGKEKDPNCLPCHSTGYGKGGFVDIETTPDLAGTTCESCHGPGEDHMGDKTKIRRTPSGATCAACHQAGGIHGIPAAE